MTILNRPGGLTPPAITTYYSTRLLERFPTDEPGVMGCLYRHIGDDERGCRWEIKEVWIGEYCKIMEWRYLA